MKEPVLVIVGGGVALVQAVLHVLTVFNVLHVTPEQEAAVTSLAGILFAAIARTQVVPTNMLPPGTIGAMADAKAAAKLDAQSGDK